MLSVSPPWLTGFSDLGPPLCKIIGAGRVYNRIPTTCRKLMSKCLAADWALIKE